MQESRRSPWEIDMMPGALLIPSRQMGGRDLE